MNTLEDTGIQERRSLPGGWETVTLLELGDLIRGVTYKKQDASTEPFTDSIPILRANNIQNGNLDQEELVHIPQNLVLDIQLITKGDILIATSSGSISVVGKAARAQNDTNTAFGAFCGLLRPSPEISSRYLGHYFSSQDYRQKASAMARGVNINNLKKAHFESLSVNLPPLNEQRRIADKLDTTLAAVKDCRQKLNSAAETIQRFRQSVLAAAVSGELTREWREERDADYPEHIFSEIVSESKTGLVRNAASQSELSEELTPYLKMDGIGNSWGYTKDSAKGITCTTKEKEEFEIKTGDWLFNTRNSLELVGKSCVWKGPGGWTYNNNILRVRFNKQVIPDWIEIYFRSPQGQKKLDSIKSATTSVAAIYQKQLFSLKIQVPSFEEQSFICQRVKKLFELCEYVESQIAASQNKVASLPSSLLTKAFRGELVPQDPNDEPASVLLQRIKAQREAEAPAKKSAKRGRKKKADAAQLAIPAGIADNHLAKVLEECGALSERALLAASELEPAVFQLQLSKELGTGGLKQVAVDGEAAYAHAAWEEEE